MIIAGDFNDWRRKADRTLADELGVVEVFEEVKGRPARTFPSVMPCSASTASTRAGSTCADARVHYAFPGARMSDHAALAATFEAHRGAADRGASRGAADEPLHARQPVELLRSGGEYFPALIGAIDGGEARGLARDLHLRRRRAGGRSPRR